VPAGRGGGQPSVLKFSTVARRRRQTELDNVAGQKCTVNKIVVNDIDSGRPRTHRVDQ
jgi:hypothetical protein